MDPKSTLMQRHPYIYAKQAYINGELHTEAAIDYMLRDREFRAEASLKFLSVNFDHDGPAIARSVIEQSWTRDAVAAACPSGNRPATLEE